MTNKISDGVRTSALEPAADSDAPSFGDALGARLTPHVVDRLTSELHGHVPGIAPGSTPTDITVRFGRGHNTVSFDGKSGALVQPVRPGNAHPLSRETLVSQFGHSPVAVSFRIQTRRGVQTGTLEADAASLLQSGAPSFLRVKVGLALNHTMHRGAHV
ncbi:MAG: hypothetical protein AAF735_05695 [Myxococcota bacterium]